MAEQQQPTTAGDDEGPHIVDLGGKQKPPTPAPKVPAQEVSVPVLLRCRYAAAPCNCGEQLPTGCSFCPWKDGH